MNSRIRDFHPKKKGNLGEAKVAAVLIEQGYPVFTEFGDLSRVDLLAEVAPGAFVKIQVKCRRSRNGAVVISKVKSGPGYEYEYQPGDVDLFAIYVYDRSRLLWVTAKEICGKRRGTTFRLDPPKNNQESLIRSAEGFISFEAAVSKVLPL